MSPDSDNSEGNPLEAFRSELDAFHSESVLPPDSNDVDVLLDAVSSGGAKGGPRTATESPATRRPFHIGARLSPAMKRWVAPALTAFALGAIGGVWGFRTLDRPGRSSTAIAPGTERGVSAPIAVLPSARYRFRLAPLRSIPCKRGHFRGCGRKRPRNRSPCRAPPRLAQLKPFLARADLRLDRR